MLARMVMYADGARVVTAHRPSQNSQHWQNLIAASVIEELDHGSNEGNSNQPGNNKSVGGLLVLDFFRRLEGGRVILVILLLHRLHNVVNISSSMILNVGPLFTYSTVQRIPRALPETSFERGAVLPRPASMTRTVQPENGASLVGGPHT